MAGEQIQTGAAGTSPTVEGGETQTTHTLEFDSPRAIQALYGNDPALLKLLEESLGVKIVTREGWVRLEGTPERVDRARQALRQLDAARQGGMPIHKHEIQYVIRSLADSAQAAPDLNALGSMKIITSARKPSVSAKTAGQLEYLRTIASHDVVFGVGPAGTGKTYLAMASALAALKREQVSRIILTRPAVEAGEALGFLPGDLQEKIFPYLRPLYDALGSLLETEEMQRYLEKRMIEIAPLAYMRGRTLDNAFIVLDEAQNTTTEQMFMFLTRMGQGAKCVVTGDRTQIDLPSNKRSGLVEAIQALKNVPGIGFTYFEEADVVRHELVQAIIRAYRHHRYGDAASPGQGQEDRRPPKN